MLTRSGKSLSKGGVAVLALVATVWLVAQLRGAHAPKGGNRAVATITAKTSMLRVPRSFFGLSTEYSELPTYESQLSIFERVLALLRVRDGGPLVLRIGGDSADKTYWNPGSRRLPPGSFVLTPGWFQQTGKLVGQLGLRVILDLNLAARSPHMAAALARAALGYLPAGTIAGFEIGNEPDRFGHEYSITDYAADYRAYARALARVAPRIPLMGPAITSTASNFNWLEGVVAADRAELGVLTGHRYPLSACAHPNSPNYPTIARVLSDTTSAVMARSVKPTVRLAHQSRRPFRLDEANSVTCGGLAGVSDTFATALWAPDALAEVLSTGADGVNVHIRPGKVNAPFLVNRHGLTARPLLYGLILFARALGLGGRLVRLDVRAPRSAHLDAWGVQGRGKGLHVLLIDRGSDSVNIDLRAAGSSDATVERLLAPSAKATAGVTLDGQQLGLDGTWSGHKTVQTIRRGTTGYRLTLPGLSAALVSVQRHSHAL